MKLISLELENFRQHANTKIEFLEGITVISGANGSGKSTILEAVSWAIYGTEAARGTKDSIKWNKAPARSKVKVELIFSLGNEIYKVVRELNKAEIYLGDNANPIVISQDEVTKYLIQKLGMNRTEFFNTYFTGQKELDFLGNQKPIERKKFISKVLGYEKVREAQEKVRLDKNNINNEIIGLKQGLDDFEKIDAEKKEYQEKINYTQKNLETKKIELDKHTLELGKLHPVWTEVKNKREDFNRYNTEHKFSLSKLNDLDKTIQELQAEHTSIESKFKRLEELEKYSDEYKKVEAKIQELEKLQKHEYERQKFLTKLEGLEQEITQQEKKLDEIYNSVETEKEIPVQISLLKDEIAEIKIFIQEETKTWTSAKQEIKTIQKQKEQEFNKIAAQYSIIEQKGEDGSCPTCNRALKGEFEQVTSKFKETIEVLSQEIKELIDKDQKLSQEPDILLQNKKTLLQKEQKYEELNKIQGKFEEKIKLYESLKLEISKRKELKEKINIDLSKIPQGFNPEVLDNLRQDFGALKKIYDEILGLKAQTIRKDKIKTSLDTAIQNKQETESILKTLETKLKELDYSEEKYKNIEEKVLEAEKAYKNAQLEVLKTEGEGREFKAVLNKILETEKIHTEKQNLIKSKQEEFNHLIELDRFYGQFLEKLNNQVRPELSEHASKFLADLTDGRYSMLELNDKYEICLYDDGEIKPVISGGEMDIANLCVRLAISRMIAQRSGKPFSLLVLDEVFGSLDENRRDNVVELLRNLINEFEQIILITHIDDIKENIDNVIKLEYDEEKGCSVLNSAPV